VAQALPGVFFFWYALPASTTRSGQGRLRRGARLLDPCLDPDCGVLNQATVPLFTDERVWALDKKWANSVISEVARAPKGQFNDLCDTASAALIHLRDHDLLSLGEEFRREERSKLVFRSREQRPSIRELYKGT
jgi:hypothetical protein